MNANELMHGKDWSGQRIGGWLVQEKFDGLRCLWNGHELVSRNGETFNAPAWFVKGLPVGIPLDGELYAGQGTLGRISNTLARHKSGTDEDWRGVQFLVFDAPGSECFEVRQSRIASLVQSCMNAHTVRTSVVKDVATLRRFLRQLHKSGGEGFMLRAPSSRYESGRSGELLKFKGPHLY